MESVIKPKRRPIPNAKQPTFLDEIVDRMIVIFGTWITFVLHITWFIAWILLGHDIQNLTLWVSLEAILLSLLILMAQKRQVEQDLIREIADLEIDRYTEKQTRILTEMVKEIGEKIGIKEFKVNMSKTKEFI